MANTKRYTGKDVNLTFIAGGTTLSTLWKRFSVEMSSTKAESTSADSAVVQRVTKQGDCSITLTGIQTTVTGGMTFAIVAALRGTAPTTMTFFDRAGTPAPILETTFFDSFPVAKWRVDDVSGEWSEDPADWTIKMSANNVDI